MKMSAILAAAAALGAVATPVFAASAGDGVKLKATYDAKHDKYCVSQEVTGQRIPVRDCRTKDEWASVGAHFGEGDAKKAQGADLAQK